MGNLPSILTPDFGLLFWMLLSFLVVFGLLAKFGFPAIVKAVEERKQYIDESLKSAREANEKLANIKAESEKLLKEARDQQATIIKEAMATREDIIRKAHDEAQAEGAKQLEEAKKQIEVEKENALLWNDLIERAMSAIRSLTKETPVIYGGIQWNSVKTLKLLEPPKYENVIYTFHFYEPLLFTHQKAHWVAAMDPNETISYPESMQYYCEKSKKLGYQGEVVTQAKSKTMGPEFIREMVEEAVSAAKNARVPLYCGEFGVIDQAPVQDTLNWFKDVDQVFREYNIGCAVWSYKEMDFGLIGSHYDPIRKDLLALWSHA